MWCVFKLELLRNKQTATTFWRCLCQSVCVPVCLCASLSVCQSVRVPVCPCANLSVCQSVRVPVCPCASLSVCQSVRVPVCPCASLSVCLPVSTRPVPIMSDPVSLPGCVLFSVLTLGDLNMLQLASDDPLNYLAGPADLLVQSPCYRVNMLTSHRQLNSCWLLQISSKYPAQCSQCQVMRGSFQICK